LELESGEDKGDIMAGFFGNFVDKLRVYLILAVICFFAVLLYTGNIILALAGAIGIPILIIVANWIGDVLLSSKSRGIARIDLGEFKPIPENELVLLLSKEKHTLSPRGIPSLDDETIKKVQDKIGLKNLLIYLVLAVILIIIANIIVGTIGAIALIAIPAAVIVWWAQSSGAKRLITANSAAKFHDALLSKLGNVSKEVKLTLDEFEFYLTDSPNIVFSCSYTVAVESNERGGKSKKDFYRIIGVAKQKENVKGSLHLGGNIDAEGKLKGALESIQSSGDYKRLKEMHLGSYAPNLISLFGDVCTFQLYIRPSATGSASADAVKGIAKLYEGLMEKGILQ